MDPDRSQSPTERSFSVFPIAAKVRLASRLTRVYSDSVNGPKVDPVEQLDEALGTPELQVVIEIPRGSFLKRGSTGRVDFISPLPCPFNYGSVPQYLGLEGDLLDAVVLGRRLPRGTTVRLRAWGAVTLIDRGMADDKLICSACPLAPEQRRAVLRFFRLYARCKGLLNYLRRRPGRNACEGWRDATEAIARARPRDVSWQGPAVPF